MDRVAERINEHTAPFLYEYLGMKRTGNGHTDEIEDYPYKNGQRETDHDRYSPTEEMPEGSPEDTHHESPVKNARHDNRDDIDVVQHYDNATPTAPEQGVATAMDV